MYGGVLWKLENRYFFFFFVWGYMGWMFCVLLFYLIFFKDDILFIYGFLDD